MKFVRIANVIKLKEVQYFNLTLMVPEETRYISADEDGVLIPWFASPVPELISLILKDDWCGEEIDYDLGTVDLEGLDWRGTMVDIGSTSTVPDLFEDL